jgi:hypothetical protein
MLENSGRRESAATDAGQSMITIRTSNGSTGTGTTVAVACKALLDGRDGAVKVRRGQFIPVENATPDDVRKSRALWRKKDRSWHVVALVDEVTEGAHP